MEITIKKENYKQLVQCVYLGNLIINEYREDEDIKSEYSDFLENILNQIIEATPETPPRFEFKNFPNEKTKEMMLADLIDRIEDSVSGYYEEYRQSLFREMLTEH